MFNVKNIKISLKTEKISLNTVVNCLKTNSVEYQIKGNYLVIRHKYVYVFFRPRTSIIQYINVTKIPCVDNIKDSINVLQHEIFQGLYIHISSEYKIDNLTAIYDTKTCIDLLKVLDNAKENYYVRYNKEKFPGLFVSTGNGTFIIFHTGKVNLVGCQNLRHLPLLFKALEKILS